jgi:hypothetical protein
VAPDHQAEREPGLDPAARHGAAPVTLVLSRAVKTGHEQEFEEVLHRLAAVPVWARPLISVVLVIPSCNMW